MATSPPVPAGMALRERAAGRHEQSSVATPHEGLSLRSASILLAYGGTMLLIGLGTSRVLTYHEILFAQPAREMLATGEWLIPTVAGVPSLHKPPGVHWLIALFFWLTGSETELVARLPSVLASLSTAWLTALLAARWMGDRVGLLAGLIQLTTVGTLMQGRMAESDALLSACVCGAMIAFVLATEAASERQGPKWLAWLFHALTGFAFLAKGLIGPALILLSCGLYFLWMRDRRTLHVLLSPIGLSILMALVLAWPLAAYRTYPPILDAWLLHHVDRFQGNLGGDKPALFYFYTAPLLMLPWTPFVFGGVGAIIRRWRQAVPLWRVLICWFVPGFVLLCASAFKHKHYLIPLLPPLSILAAVGLHRALLSERLRRQSGKLSVLTLAGCVAAIATLYALHVDDALRLSLLLALAALGLAVAAWFAHKRSIRWQLAALFATAWLVAVGAQLFIMPGHDSYRSQTELAARVNPVVPAEQKLYVLGLPENQITYYLTPPLTRIDHPDAVWRHLVEKAGEPGTDLHALTPEFLLPVLHRIGVVEVLDRCATVNRYSTDANRVTFIRLQPRPLAPSPTRRGGREER